MEVIVYQEFTDLNAFAFYDEEADLAVILKADLPIQVGDNIELCRDCSEDLPVYSSFVSDIESLVVNI